MAITYRQGATVRPLDRFGSRIPRMIKSAAGSS